MRLSWSDFQSSFFIPSPRWSTAAYDDSDWHQVVEVPLNEETAYFDQSFHYDDLQMVGQIGTNAT